MQASTGSWMVARQREDGPPELYFFDDAGEALVFFERAGMQWSGILLARIVVGVELGNIEARQAAIESHAERYEAAVRSSLACTGVAASWCPVHGTCSCERDDVGEAGERGGTCALHSDESEHAEGPT